MSETGAWMPLYWADYLADTTHLTTEEHGAYLLLIGTYWRRARALPDDDRFLATVTKSSMKKWKIIRPKVIEFFSLRDGHLHHERIENEILKATERLNSARANGRAGGLAKSKLPTPTPTSEESKKELIDSKILNGLGNGLGNERTTIKDPADRIARFQKKLAQQIGAGGWMAVAAATNLDAPDHSKALELCKTAARAMGKGWPKNWPLNHGVM